MIIDTSGDMFDIAAQFRVNTINCVGVMGKGIALAFKYKYPVMYNKYREDCKNNEIKIGEIRTYDENGETIINFPTKMHWRNPSEYYYIEKGLEALKRYLADRRGIVTIPALGCSNGGLDWNLVKPMIYQYLNDLDNLEIYLFKPWR